MMLTNSPADCRTLSKAECAAHGDRCGYSMWYGTCLPKDVAHNLGLFSLFPTKEAREYLRRHDISPYLISRTGLAISSVIAAVLDARPAASIATFLSRTASGGEIMGVMSSMSTLFSGMHARPALEAWLGASLGPIATQAFAVFSGAAAQWVILGTGRKMADLWTDCARRLADIVKEHSMLESAVEAARVVGILAITAVAATVATATVPMPSFFTFAYFMAVQAVTQSYSSWLSALPSILLFGATRTAISQALSLLSLPSLADEPQTGEQQRRAAVVAVDSLRDATAASLHGLESTVEDMDKHGFKHAQRAKDKLLETRQSIDHLLHTTVASLESKDTADSEIHAELQRAAKQVASLQHEARNDVGQSLDAWTNDALKDLRIVRGDLERLRRRATARSARMSKRAKDLAEKAEELSIAVGQRIALLPPDYDSSIPNVQHVETLSRVASFIAPDGPFFSRTQHIKDDLETFRKQRHEHLRTAQALREDMVTMSTDVISTMRRIVSVVSDMQKMRPESATSSLLNSFLSAISGNSSPEVTVSESIQEINRFLNEADDVAREKGDLTSFVSKASTALDLASTQIRTERDSALSRLTGLVSVNQTMLDSLTKRQKELNDAIGAAPGEDPVAALSKATRAAEENVVKLGNLEKTIKLVSKVVADSVSVLTLNESKSDRASVEAAVMDSARRLGVDPKKALGAVEFTTWQAYRREIVAQCGEDVTAGDFLKTIETLASNYTVSAAEARRVALAVTADTSDLVAVPVVNGGVSAMDALRYTADAFLESRSGPLFTAIENSTKEADEIRRSVGRVIGAVPELRAKVDANIAALREVIGAIETKTADLDATDKVYKAGRRAIDGLEKEIGKRETAFDDLRSMKAFSETEHRSVKSALKQLDDYFKSNAVSKSVAVVRDYIEENAATKARDMIVEGVGERKSDLADVGSVSQLDAWSMFNLVRDKGNKSAEARRLANAARAVGVMKGMTDDEVLDALADKHMQEHSVDIALTFFKDSLVDALNKVKTDSRGLSAALTKLKDQLASDTSHSFENRLALDKVYDALYKVDDRVVLNAESKLEDKAVPVTYTTENTIAQLVTGMRGKSKHSVSDLVSRFVRSLAYTTGILPSEDGLKKVDATVRRDLKAQFRPIKGTPAHVAIPRIASQVVTGAAKTVGSAVSTLNPYNWGKGVEIFTQPQDGPTTREDAVRLETQRRVMASKGSDGLLARVGNYVIEKTVG